ncbi:unnamed protein product [Boreogadus saida]
MATGLGVAEERRGLRPRVSSHLCFFLLFLFFIRRTPGERSPSSVRSGPPSPTSSPSSSSSSSSSDEEDWTPQARSSSSSSSSLLYSGGLQGNLLLPLVHRVSGVSLTASSPAPSRVYTTGTIRYAPAEVSLGGAPGGGLLPNAAFVDGSGFGLDPKTPMELLYHHVHRLNMASVAAASVAAAGPFAGASPNAVATGANGGGGQLPTATNVFSPGEGLFSALPFPVYGNGIHSAQTALERKED